MKIFRIANYYLQSIFKLGFGIKNWPTIFSLFLRSDQVGRHLLRLRRPHVTLWVRGAMDVWAVKETFLDAFYTRYGVPVEDGWTVIDIGAGVGDFSILAAYGHPNAQVYALEPYPGSYDLLVENIALNTLPQVHAFPLAVWSRSGRLLLDLTRGEPLQIVSIEEERKEENVAHFTVGALTLENLLADQGIERVDLLKLDCEGAEYEILMAAPSKVLARVQRIILETHDLDDQRNHNHLIQFLESAGYRVNWYKNQVHADLGYLFATRMDDGSVDFQPN